MKNKEYLPVNLAIEGKRFLVVGGGKIATHKIDLLTPRGADILVVAREVEEKIVQLEKNSLLKLKKKHYEESDLEHVDYVIAATDDEGLNKRVYDQAKERGLLVNVVDDPKHCDFIFPSILRRGTVTFTVSTSGQSPFLSAFLRQIIENGFGEEWVTIGELASKYRKHVMKAFIDEPEKKNESYKRFLDVNWVELIRKEGEEAAETYYDQLLNSLEEL